MLQIVLDILQVIIPPTAILIGVYLILNHYNKKQTQNELYKLKATSGKDTIPMRLQACERLTLLVNRISPVTLVPKLQASSATAADLHNQIINTVKSEFEHNVTQQLYISTKTWNGLVFFKNDIINLTRSKLKEVGKNASSLELSQAILKHYIEQGENVITPEQVIESIKLEVKKLFI